MFFKLYKDASVIFSPWDTMMFPFVALQRLQAIFLSLNDI